MFTITHASRFGQRPPALGQELPASVIEGHGSMPRRGRVGGHRHGHDELDPCLSGGTLELDRIDLDIDKRTTHRIDHRSLQHRGQLVHQRHLPPVEGLEPVAGEELILEDDLVGISVDEVHVRQSFGPEGGQDLGSGRDGAKHRHAEPDDRFPRFRVPAVKSILRQSVQQVGQEDAPQMLKVPFVPHGGRRRIAPLPEVGLQDHAGRVGQFLAPVFPSPVDPFQGTIGLDRLGIREAPERAFPASSEASSHFSRSTAR